MKERKEAGDGRERRSTGEKKKTAAVVKDLEGGHVKLGGRWRPQYHQPSDMRPHTNYNICYTTKFSSMGTHSSPSDIISTALRYSSVRTHI